jgi:cytochrome oxidase Cu insertion factor (SCO1/SenC/PrrC family)
MKLAALLATAAAVVAAAAIALSAGPSRTRSGGEPSPDSSIAEGLRLPDGIRAAGFTLSDQYARPLSLERDRGQVVVLTFLSPSCGATCVLIAQQIRDALDELDKAHARPPAVLALSTDPDRDTRRGISRFLSEASLAGRMLYLTGSLAQLKPIWHAYGLQPSRSGRVAITERSGVVLLLDKRGFERFSFPVEDLTPEGLAQDIGKLQAE